MDKQEPQSSTQARVRNILTLEERVRAINAYDRKPMYTKVASMFHCSWEQIKNIVQNRKAIMDFYEATKKTYSNSDPDQELMRQRKINFLGECLYEYIQRAQYHKKADLNEEIIRVKAIEFRELIQIENFTPVKAWINHFKATYNISLSQRQITLTRTPPASLDLKDIMTYCSRYKTTTDKQSQPQPSQNLYKLATTMAVSTANEATLEEMKQRRQRKINFLMKALYEYIQRSQYHHRMTLNEDHLRKIACELKDMLKIDSFYPNKAWFNHFKSIYDFSTSQRTIVFSRAPPFSLDLKDILSYCSRHDAKNQPTPVPIKKLPLKNVPKDEVKAEKPQTVEQGKTVVEQAKIRVINHTQLAAVKTIEIADDDQEIDVKPDLAELEVTKEKSNEPVEAPPLKKPKLEVVEENDIEKPVHSPGHWSEHSGDDEEELPKKVTNYADALKLLKPLEEFAMLEENYRVIGLISQLEEIFKHPPKS